MSTEQTSGPPVEKKRKRRGQYLSCWVSQELFDQVTGDAQRAGLNRSDYMKSVLGDALVPRKARVTGPAKIQLTKTLGHLGKLGSNMNQIAKKVNIAAKLGRWETIPTAAAMTALILETQAMLDETQQQIHAAMGKASAIVGPSSSGLENAPDDDAREVEPA